MTAIIFFFLGAFINSRLGFWLGPVNRLTLILSFSFQAVLLVIAAALVQGKIAPGLIPKGTDAWIQLVPLPMLSFQAGQQSVVARQLGFNEIPTTVLTSIYCDLANDPELFASFNKNWKRNRRFLAALLLLIGAIIGGWLSRTDDGMAAGLWMAAAIKACITVAWLFWKRDKEQ